MIAEVFRCNDCHLKCEIICVDRTTPPAPVRPIVCPFGGIDKTDPDAGFKKVSEIEGYP